MKMNNSRNAITGELGRLAVTGKLAEVGFLSFPTPPNYPAADLVVYDADSGVNSKPLFVQVKTNRGKQSSFWLLGQLEKVRETPNTLWWILVDLRADSKSGPTYFVIPGRHTKKLAKAPVKGNSFDGQASIKRSEIREFENDWAILKKAFRLKL